MLVRLTRLMLIFGLRNKLWNIFGEVLGRSLRVFQVYDRTGKGREGLLDGIMMFGCWQSVAARLVLVWARVAKSAIQIADFLIKSGSSGSKNFPA